MLNFGIGFGVPRIMRIDHTACMFKKHQVAESLLNFFPVPDFGNAEYSGSDNQSSLLKILPYQLLIRGFSLLHRRMCVYISIN